MRTRRAVAIVLGLIVVGAATALYVRQNGSLPGLGEPPLLLVDAGAAVLDTVRLGGRRVTATLNGTVTEVAPDGTVWLDTGSDAFPLLFPDEAVLDVEDRVLAVGRVRAKGDRRWVDVDAWSLVARYAQ